MLRRQILEALEGVDVLVMPTSSIPAPLIPEKAGIGSKQEVIDGYKGRRSYTSPFNLANTPALSINCGFTSEGLPVGLQIAGAPVRRRRGCSRRRTPTSRRRSWGARRAGGLGIFSRPPQTQRTIGVPGLSSFGGDESPNAL